MTTDRETEVDRRRNEPGFAVAMQRAIDANPSFWADVISNEYAALNLMDGKPAFASEAGVSNALAGQLHCAANRLGSIKAAQDEYRPNFIRMGQNVMDVTWLNTLIPLNNAGVADLSEAYERAGTFRTRGELIRRFKPAVPVLVDEVA